MTITLGTNIPSFSSRIQFNKVSDELSDVFKRLSTGKKINCAGDDAAGLVISQNMQAKIDGSRQAMNNIQTAESFLTVAEDGMVSIGDHFQRINNLLTGMANDTNDVDSRTAAVREVIERLDEINRLAESINFNGMKMLDGSAKTIIVQMGPDTDEATSTLDISPALTDCHLTEFKAELPPELNPDSLTNEDGSIVLIPNPKTDESITSEYVQVTKEDDGTYTYSEYTGETTDFTSAFNANNENCRKYMGIIQNAIATLATHRGLLGAYENRMQSSYDALTTRIESLESAKVPYVDTDIAQEATNLTQKQIMEQINIAVLSNANQNQQMAISLLG